MATLVANMKQDLLPTNVTLLQNIRQDVIGSVFNAQTDNDELLSAKVFDLNIDFLTTQIKQQVVTLIQKKNKSLSQLNHPFLHKYHNATVNDQFTKLHCYYDKVNMTTSNDSNAAVSCLSALCKEKALTEKDAAFYIAQVVLAIEELHKNGLLFGYLTIDSILVEEDGYIKLFDYSLLPLECFANVNKTIAPKVYSSRRITKATDWQAVAQIAFQLLTTLQPGYINNRVVTSCTTLNHAAKDFLLQLIERNSAQLSENVANITKHYFFKNIDWELLLKKAIKAPLLQNQAANNDIMQQDEDAKISLDDFDLLHVIGRGPISKVIKVKQKDNGKIWAMKVVVKAQVHPTYAKTIAENTTVPLCKHKHSYLNTTKFVIETVEKLYLFSDVLYNDYLWYNFSGNNSDDTTAHQFYAAELLLALECLHNNNIICKNLSPSNVLLDAEGHIRLTDFGLAQEVTPLNDMNLQYLAPEIISRHCFRREVDFWSFGVWLYELLTARDLFYCQYKSVVKTLIMRNNWFERSHPTMSPEAKDLISKLLVSNPTDRLTIFKEIKSHAFFNLIDWQALAHKKITAPMQPTKIEKPTSTYLDGNEPMLFKQLESMSSMSTLNEYIYDDHYFGGVNCKNYHPPPPTVCSLNGGHFHMKRGAYSEHSFSEHLSKLRLQSTHSFSIYSDVEFEQPINPGSTLLSLLRNSYLKQIFVLGNNFTTSCSTLNFASCIADLLVSGLLKTLLLPTSFIGPLTTSLTQLEKTNIAKLSTKNISITFYSSTFSQIDYENATTLSKLLNSYTSNPAKILYEFKKCENYNQLATCNQQEVRLACKLFATPNSSTIVAPFFNAKHIHIYNAPSSNELQQLWALPELETLTVSRNATQQLIDAFVELDRTNNWPTNLSTIGLTSTTVDNKKQLISLIKSGNNSISNLMLEKESVKDVHLELLIEESVQHLNGLFINTSDDRERFVNTDKKLNFLRKLVSWYCSKVPIVKLRKFGTMFRDEIRIFGELTNAIYLPNSIRNIHLLEKEGRNVLVSLLMISSIRSNELFLPFEVIWLIVSYCNYCSFITCYQHRSHFLYESY